MMQKLGCPSYIQTYTNDEPVAIIPWDQFHTLMSDIMTVNRQIVEVNTLLGDCALAYDVKWTKEQEKVYKRVLMYLGDLNES